ncbi:hypothetical protein ACFVFI_08045 [Streptomyces sp. NPDC057705]|uniref:hypothetical protein n=1 Tax=Streptomyces sp. NPDC057705 TaxID=3346222 RepID=UPI0036AEC1FA
MARPSREHDQDQDQDRDAGAGAGGADGSVVRQEGVAVGESGKSAVQVRGGGEDLPVLLHDAQCGADRRERLLARGREGVD